MELRVHGIGGTSVASMLDQADGDALVPRWPRGPGMAPHVWQGSRPDVLAFHWARLTSGSRWFVLWPLALPFTLINVAGFMHSAGWSGRVLRAVHGLLCLVATTWFATWLIFGGQELVGAKDWDAWVGVALAGAIALVVVAPSLVRCGWEAGQAPRVGQPRASLENPAFFRDGRKLWALHATVLLASAGAVGLRADADHQSLRLAAQRSVVDVGMAIVFLIVLLLVLTLIAAVIGPRRAWQWALAAVGAIGLAPGGRWTNTFRFTDHVGRTVFGEEKGWVPTATPPVRELQDRWWLDDATEGCRDCCIADPDANQARVLGHNDYWEDLRVGRVAGRAPATGAKGR